MSTVARFLRMAADAAEDFQTKARQRYDDQVDAGVDSQAVVDALATLAASVAAGVTEVVPRHRRGCSCQSDQGGEQSGIDIDGAVERVFGRLGLVQETELAALRKRVVDLEAKLSQ